MSLESLRALAGQLQADSDARALGAGRAEFDWYAATIDDDPTTIAEALASWLGGSWRTTRGMRNYSAGAEIVRDGDVIARMLYGGNGDAPPNAWASGADTPPFVEAVRALWPRHRVTRVDSAYDFKVGEPWAKLLGLCEHVARHLPDGTERKRPLALDTRGDWRTEGSPKGRTLYVGSMQSPVFARLYEKGKQMRGAFPDQADKYSAGWVRLELQVEPQKAAKWEYATLSPEEVWGAAKWARQLHGDVFGSELAASPVTYVRPADDARAWMYLLKQYGPLLRRRFDLAREKTPDATLEALWAGIGLDLGRALLGGAGDDGERFDEANVADVLAGYERREQTPDDAVWEGERIGPDTSPGVRFNVHERARIVVDAERARAASDALYRQGPDDL